MHSSRMRTTRSSGRAGVVSTRYPPGADPPGADAPHWEQTPPEADTPQEQIPPLWTEFLTHACENITLNQTSF